MIDRDWFAGLRFEAVTGGEVVESHLGSTKAVFIVQYGNGEKRVLKTYKNILGFHIREIPPFLTKEQLYDSRRVNEKLEHLIDDPFYDVIVRDYDRLHSIITMLLYKYGTVGAITSLWTPESVETIPFIVNSPGITRRIREIQELTSPDVEKINQVITMNGPNFPIYVWPGQTKWQGVNLDNLSPLRGYDPKSLHGNPLFIWGGAILEGFFTDDEMLDSAKYVKAKIESFEARVGPGVIINQIDAIASLLAQYLEDINPHFEHGSPGPPRLERLVRSRLERLVRFCAYCGFIFDVHDKNGNEICNGMKFM